MAATRKPPFILLENVPDLAEGSGGSNLQFIVDSFAELGYVLAWRVLNSVNYGVPQRRRQHGWKYKSTITYFEKSEPEWGAM